MWYKVYVTLTITHQIRKPGKTRVLPAKVRVTTCAPAGPSRLMKASKPMPTQPTHTPTPWKVAESVAQKDAWYLEGLYNDQWIAIGDDDGTMDFDDAAFIVECVNQHAALQAAKAELLDLLKKDLLYFKREKMEATVRFHEDLIARASGEGAR